MESINLLSLLYQSTFRFRITIYAEQNKDRTIMKDISLLTNQVYELSDEAYKIIDKNFNIISCNKKYAEINNQASLQDIIGKKCYEYLRSANCGTEKCSLVQIMKGKETVEATIEMETDSNEIKYFFLNIKPFKNEKNEILGIIECFIDITAIKKAELSLIENETQLKKINATNNKLFSIIAHDLRLPFNSILGFSELLMDNKNDFEIAEREEFAKGINTTAQNTLSLLDNLLNWAKAQSGKIIIQPEKIILSSIILEVIEILTLVANFKSIALIYNQSNEIEVVADEDMVKLVLRNLVSNAIKFTKSGGDVNISAISNQDEVEISISDNGVGMNDKARKKLFKIATNVSTSGTANEKGSGLGLVLCKEFVEKLGGTIWVESEEGVGSDFKFTLPLIK